MLLVDERCLQPDLVGADRIEKWEHEAEAEIASHFEARNAVRTTGAIEPITTKSSARS